MLRKLGDMWMKIKEDVYFICDVCNEYIKKGDNYYILQFREAGTKFAHEKKKQNNPIHFCLKCVDNISRTLKKH